MIKINRVVFMMAWCACAIALFIWPGFEAKGFIFGHISGYWPFLLADRFGFEFGSKWVLLGMLGLSGAQLLLCSWIMDRTAVTGWVWKAALFLITIVFLATFIRGCGDFETWRYQSMAAHIRSDNSPLLSRIEYFELALIPRSLVYGLWVLHTFVIGGCVLGVVVHHKKK
ncbi:hypothetical protein P4E94_08350 [Pontiellaceae bacterium B12219]|nr:hypothetical protein [Pontiellaceae bacterium B12219]